MNVAFGVKEMGISAARAGAWREVRKTGPLGN